MARIGLFIVISTIVSSAYCASRCAVTVPDDCPDKCLDYAFDKTSRCLTCDCVPAEGLWEEDIKLDDESKELLAGFLNNKRKGGSATARKWFNDKRGDDWQIPYTLDSSLSSSAVIAIKKAIADYHKHTCLRFVRRKDQYHYINFIASDGCWSYVGMKQYNPNDVSIGFGCEDKGTVIHEVMHALGFWHEQSRPDRDQYIHIVKANIIPSVQFNFQSYDTSEVESYGSPYDLSSIMHYPSWAFSRNGKPTITLANGDPYDSNQRDGFSESDIAQINAMYQCGSRTTTTTTTTKATTTTSAPSTTTATTRTTKNPAKKCVNLKKSCKALARKGACKNGRIRRLCRLSCNACKTNYPVCRDVTALLCKRMKDPCKRSHYVKRCAKTCGKCT